MQMESYHLKGEWIRKDSGAHYRFYRTSLVATLDGKSAVRDWALSGATPHQVLSIERIPFKLIEFTGKQFTIERKGKQFIFERVQS